LRDADFCPRANGSAQDEFAEATALQIDALVYKLYGLAEEEITVVAGQR